MLLEEKYNSFNVSTCERQINVDTSICTVGAILTITSKLDIISHLTTIMKPLVCYLMDDTTTAVVAVESHQFNQGFVKFDLGIVCPSGAESFHVKSKFPRIKPRFERDPVENDDLEKLTDNLLTWVNTHFVTIGQETYFKELAHIVVLFSVHVNPFSELYSKDMELCINFYFWLWYADDVIEDAIEKQIPFKDLKQGTNQLESVLLGMYDTIGKKFDDVPNYPRFGQLFNSLMDLHNISKSHLPGYEKRVQTFNRILQKFYTGQRWFCIDEIDERYSEDTFMSWRKVVAFFDGIAEISALIHGVTLKDDILRSSSYQRILDIGNILGGLSNDLLGMKKEFANGQKDSLIIFLVLKKKMPLEKAVQYVCKLLETTLMDYILLKEVILKEFDKDENLVRYLDIFDSLIDGQNFLYTQSQRHRCAGSVLLTR